MPDHLCSFTARAESVGSEKAESIASGICSHRVDVGEGVQHVACWPTGAENHLWLLSDIGIVIRRGCLLLTSAASAVIITNNVLHVKFDHLLQFDNIILIFNRQSFPNFHLRFCQGIQGQAQNHRVSCCEPSESQPQQQHCRQPLQTHLSSPCLHKLG